jgi:K+-transporting ATPase KdpF subunit
VHAPEPATFLNSPGESENVRPDFRRHNDHLLSDLHRLRARVRKVTGKGTLTNLESISGLAVSALLLIYLACALPRPEKF